MKSWKNRSALGAFLALCVGLAGCNGSSTSLVSITAAAAPTTISIGSTSQVSVTGKKSDGTSYAVTSNVTYASSAKSIATVSATGLVTGVAPGAAMITASTSGLQSAVTVTVVASAVQVLHASPDAPKVDIFVDGTKAI